MFKRVGRRLLKVVAIMLYCIVLVICAVQLNFLWLFGYSPTKRDIVLPSLNVSSELYTADSVLIGRYFKEDRDPVIYDSISPNILNALIATEDVRFYKHHGVDLIGLGSSAISVLRGNPRGGSTISQQLSKNLYKTRYQQSQGLLGKIPGVGLIVTKFKEWMTAYKLESRYDKQDIITMYLNTVSFSNNAYGVKSAALRYYNKLPSDVTVDEAGVLIGMLKATTMYNPVRNPENAIKRRNVVLSQMMKEQFISKSDFDKYSKKSLGLNLNYREESGSNDSYLRSAVEKWLDKWAEENDIDIYTSGLKIYTTIDSRMQKIAQDAVNVQMKELQRRFDNLWRNREPWRDKEGNVIPNFLEEHAKKLAVYKDAMEASGNDSSKVFQLLNMPREKSVFTWDGMETEQMSTMDSLRHYLTMLNVGMMAMDPYSGNIKVWIGGIDHRFFKFDHVNQAKRQAGSTFKPFAYMTALESGMAPCDKYQDVPVKIEFVNNKGENEIWEPKNADWTFSHQEMSLRWAMARSLNSITAQITNDVGWDKVVDMAHKLGIQSRLESVPSVGLGSNDVSVFEMVRGYSAFMNSGKNTEPILVSKIVDMDGDVIAEFKSEQKQVVSRENAWLMTYMLRGTVEEPGGTSQALWEWDLFKDGNEIGGKTGTSSDYVDGWYMGVTKDLVAGVWVGCDERSIHFTASENGEGSKTALPIYATFMEELYKHPELGVTFGKFPEAPEEVTKQYQCPSPRIIREPTVSDSTGFDSISRVDPILEELESIQNIGRGLDTANN